MTAPRFFIVLAVVLGLFAFFFWRMHPEPRIDQVISDVPPARLVDSGQKQRPLTD